MTFTYRHPLPRARARKKRRWGVQLNGPRYRSAASRTDCVGADRPDAPQRRRIRLQLAHRQPPRLIHRWVKSNSWLTDPSATDSSPAAPVSPSPPPCMSTSLRSQHARPPPNATNRTPGTKPDRASDPCATPGQSARSAPPCRRYHLGDRWLAVAHPSQCSHTREPRQRPSSRACSARRSSARRRAVAQDRIGPSCSRQDGSRRSWHCVRSQRLTRSMSRRPRRSGSCLGFRRQVQLPPEGEREVGLARDGAGDSRTHTSSGPPISTACPLAQDLAWRCTSTLTT
jgi:hypothetical protein